MAAATKAGSKRSTTSRPARKRTAPSKAAEAKAAKELTEALSASPAAPVEAPPEEAILFPNDTRINSVVEYAKEHSEDGWDRVKEMTRQEVYEVVKHTQSDPGAIKKMTAFLGVAQLFPNDTRINSVFEYAQEHYEEGGWDIVAETMSREDVYEIVKHTQTEKGAIKKVAAHIGAVAEFREDIQNA